jgi:hypothetical protein
MRKLTLLFVVGSVGLAACGGEDAPSKAEFANSANNICADLEKASERLGTPDSVAEIEKFASDAEKEVDEAVAKLEGLDRPEGENGKKAKEFVEAIKKDTNDKIKPALNDLRNAAQAKDEKAIVAAAEKIQAVETPDSDRLANEIGARSCAD